MDAAACVGVGVDVFFPERGDSYIEAKAVCAACPVREPCRDAVDRAEQFLRGVDVQGLYAGETPGERRRRRAAAAANEPVTPFRLRSVRRGGAVERS
jgi:WhiB family redox-sensing transcriptional regulator